MEIKNLKIEDYSPLNGEFGTTIFFDTNAPHFAGKIHNKNSLRKIIRFKTFEKIHNKLENTLSKNKTYLDDYAYCPDFGVKKFSNNPTDFEFKIGKIQFKPW